MSILASRAESKVISDVHQVHRMLKDQPLNKDKTLTLPLEVFETPYITVQGLVPGDPKARTTKEDPTAPMIEEKHIVGFSVYSGRNAGGSFQRVVAHVDGSHVLSVIKIQQDTDAAGVVSHRLYISKTFVQEMLSVKENETLQDAIKKVRSLDQTVYF